jgi:integrase
MPVEKIPAFMRWLAASPTHPSIRGALQPIVLTALRTNEVLKLQWSDLAEDGHSFWLNPLPELRAWAERCGLQALGRAGAEE